ncbi:MAG: acyl-CoA dehydrogenase family protein, partial [Proteobacteria bacterium]|nr:acyl-CoA dehydrogenase family protein [Pseudomonadota bacterium]
MSQVIDLPTHAMNCGTGNLKGKALGRVGQLTDVIAKGGDGAQQIRRLPDDCVSTLVDEGFFRFTLPVELGGEDATTIETIEVLEAMAAIDGSVAWNVMLGSEINAMAAGGMDKALAKEIYLDNPRVVMCGGGGPGSVPARAEKQSDGSYKIWGESTFISGCYNADWCFMPAPEVTPGQDPKTIDPTTTRMRFMHKSQWEILDTWDVAGLRGSGSNTVKADGAIVRAEHADIDLVALPALYDNPVFRIPVPLRLSYNKVAIALGVARGALDAFVDLANNKVPMLSPSKLMERPIAQSRIGEAEGKFRAARAYVMEAMAEVEDELNAGAEGASAAATQNARLACTYAANACMEVVDVVHNTAGTSASYI